MFDKYRFYLGLIITLLLNILAGYMVLLNASQWATVLACLSFVLISFLFLYLVWLQRQIGIISFLRKRGLSQPFLRCLNNVQSSADFLVSWGGSLRNLSQHPEKTFTKLAENGRILRFLLVMPGSQGESKRQQTRGSWPAKDHEDVIRWLLRLKARLGTYSENFQIALYQEEPLWAIVILDNTRAIIGFYGKGESRYINGLVVKNIDNKQTFFSPYKKHYERIWSSATQVVSESQLNELIKPTSRTKHK